MKKLLLVFTLMANLYVANAQSKVHFGLKAGANFSGWTGFLAAGTSLRPGFHAGGLAIIPVNVSFAIKPELFFSSEGVKAPGSEYLVNYVRVPVLLQYRHSSGFQMETGPQLGLLINARYKSDMEDKDIKDQFLPIDASWGIGFGYTLKSGPGFTVRYNFGLSEFGSKEDPLKTAVISAGFIYEFGK